MFCRSVSARLCLVLLAPALMVVAACGGGGDSNSSTAGASEGPPPANLVGAYTTTIKSSDLPPNPSPPLTDGGPDWTLTIATKGGPGGGPALTIASSQDSSALTSAKLGVSGKTLFLHKEECENKSGTNTTFVESEYRWSLSGKTLRLTNVKNGCPDKVDLTILTAAPYAKQG